jgi:hypothetical protein
MDSEQLLAIASAGLAASEALSFIPKVKSNGIFQLIFNILKFFISKKK